MGIAETATITTTVLVVALVAILATVALGFYRTRRSSAGAEQYQALATRAADAEEMTAKALDGLRAEVGATRDELTEVNKRLGELERLLSEIG